MNTPTLLPFIPTCLASVSWDFSVLLSSVPWCVLRASHKRAAGLVMKHWFSFTGIIQPRCARRGTIPGVLSGLHTHLPCGLVLAELSVPPVGPAGHSPVVTPPSEFAVCVFLGSLSPAGGTFYLCQERSPCVTEEDFFVYLYSLARSLIFLPVQCEGIPSCPHVPCLSWAWPRGLSQHHRHSCGQHWCCRGKSQCWTQQSLQPTEGHHAEPKHGRCSAGWGAINAQGKAAGQCWKQK